MIAVPYHFYFQSLTLTVNPDIQFRSGSTNVSPIMFMWDLDTDGREPQSQFGHSDRIPIFVGLANGEALNINKRGAAIVRGYVTVAQFVELA